MIQSQQVLESWIREIQLNGKGLTTWEDEFVDSVDTQLYKYGKLSEKQQEILERIYAEKTK